MHARVFVIVLALLALAFPVFGAQSFLGGFSGNIITPDAVIAPTGTWEVSFHDFLSVTGDEDVTALGVIYGVTPDLEIGASFLKDGNGDVALCGKLQLLPETATRPAILVGAFDLAGSVDWLNEDPSFYVAASKNVTSFASNVAGRPSRPLRLTAGFGSGMYNGMFAGLDWTYGPKLSLMAEYVNQGFEGNSEINAGIRYAATNNIRLDAGTIDFENFVFGGSITTRF